MDLATFISRVRRNAVDTSPISPRYKDPVYIDAANDAVGLVTRLTRSHFESVDVPVAAGAWEASLPASVLGRVMAPRFVVEKATRTEIHIRKIDEINDHRAASAVAVAVPDICTTAMDKLYVAPPPTAAIDVEALLYAIPALMTATTDTVPLKPELLPAAINLASSAMWNVLGNVQRAREYDAAGMRELEPYIPENLKAKVPPERKGR